MKMAKVKAKTTQTRVSKSTCENTCDRIDPEGPLPVTFDIYTTDQIIFELVVRGCNKIKRGIFKLKNFIRG
jgi:hypothetical protein